MLKTLVCGVSVIQIQLYHPSCLEEDYNIFNHTISVKNTRAVLVFAAEHKNNVKTRQRYHRKDELRSAVFCQVNGVHLICQIFMNDLITEQFQQQAKSDQVNYRHYSKSLANRNQHYTIYAKVGQLKVSNNRVMYHLSMKLSDTFDQNPIVPFTKLGKTHSKGKRSHGLTLRAKIKVTVKNKKPMPWRTKTCLQKNI